MDLAKRYGELDGEIVYYYVTHFADVSKTLNTTQKTQLEGLVDALGYVPCTGAFLYSSPIAVPEIMNTHFLFAGTMATSTTDLNGDGEVDILDISIVAKAFGSRPGDPNWNEIADLNKDDIIDIVDITMVAIDFGKTVLDSASAYESDTRSIVICVLQFRHLMWV